MNFIEKLKVVYGTIGKMQTAKEMDITPLTLQKKTADPGRFKYSEIQKIEELYNDVVNLPIK